MRQPVTKLREAIRGVIGKTRAHDLRRRLQKGADGAIAAEWEIAAIHCLGQEGKIRASRSRDRIGDVDLIYTSHNVPGDVAIEVTAISDDSLHERNPVYAFIPYIDVGMDVVDCGEHGFLISGQVFLSTPGNPCMRCCRYVTEQRLRREGERYGAAGSAPQVIWSNGVLASTAIGLLVQLVTPWHPNPPQFVYLEYDGNKGTVVPSAYMRLASSAPPCHHYRSYEIGDPFFDIHGYHIAAVGS